MTSDEKLVRSVEPVVRLAVLEDILSVPRASSLMVMVFGLACCAMELMAAGAAKFDYMRFGGVPRGTPRQSDLMIVAGTISRKMAPAVITLWEQMAVPKWVIAMGNCAISGGPFAYDGQYAIVNGADEIIPVDVYIPGCPPRPEGVIQGFLTLQDKITGGQKNNVLRRFDRVGGQKRGFLQRIKRIS
ncbi:MAG: NADH-quinone oxidoreductase subunit NuoB [Candidatus Adiutricales bacterium]